MCGRGGGSAGGSGELVAHLWRTKKYFKKKKVMVAKIEARAPGSYSYVVVICCCFFVSFLLLLFFYSLAHWTTTCLIRICSQLEHYLSDICL